MTSQPARPTLLGLEVDLLGGLSQLQERPAALRPLWLLVPGSAEGGEAMLHAHVVALLTREARQFHELEADVATRRALAFQERAEALRGEPGEAWARDVAEAARREAAQHRAQLLDLDARVTGALQGFSLASPARQAELVAAQGPHAVVRLYDDGYALEDTQEARLAARRAFLGLPKGADWFEVAPR